MNRLSFQRERSRRVIRHGFARALRLEMLEDRRLFDAGGNTIGTATDLGLLPGTRIVTDLVGQADPADWYRFRLTTGSDFHLRMDGMSADADVQVLDSAGRVIAGSYFGGASAEAVDRVLAAGDYFVHVYPFASANTNYRLSLQAMAPGPPDSAGNSMLAARDLGTLSGIQTVTEFVGQADPTDWYHFRLTTGSDFHLRMDGMSADADVQLLDSAGRVIAGSYFGGASAEAVDRVLAAGDYFVQVYPYGSANTNYRLSLQAAPSGPPDSAGNSMSAARDLGALNGMQTVTEFVGQADSADWYHFRLTTGSDFHLRMDGMSADADVQLLDSAGRVIAGSYYGGASAEAVDRVLAAGDYFVQVYPYGSANTNYRLSLQAAAVQQGMDVTTMTPIPDYAGHVGADYMGPEGTAVSSPVSGQVIAVGPINGYGTMAVAISVNLPSWRVFASELAGATVTTNRVIVVIGHLRPSRNLVANADASYRFNSGRNELGYNVGDTITVGQRLGYLEARDYNGASADPHAHVTISDAVNPPSNIWQGRGLPDGDPRRARYIRPELSWGLLR